MTTLKTIMVVDDDPGVLRVVSGFLCRDYEVQTVASGAEALTRLGKKPPDLILLDIMMPGLDGFEVLLAALRSNPKQRVVMLTGASDLDMVLMAMGLGAQGYVTKPFSAEDLRNAVDHLLQPCEGSASGGCPWHAAAADMKTRAGASFDRPSRR